MGKTHAFLRAVLGFDEYCGIRAVARPDIGDEDREGFKRLLRAGMARRLVPGVWAMAHPAGIIMGIRQLTPPPFETAAALCRLHGRNMAIPMDVAEFTLGLHNRPRLHEVVGPFPWDGEERLEVAGVALEPVDPRIPSMSPAGQAVALAGSKVRSEDLRTAANGILASVREWLMSDLASMTSEERAVAQAILAVPAVVPRTAPEGFIPPVETCPTAHGWRLVEFGDREVLVADLVTGHPDLGDDRLKRSSPLMWVDERIGWLTAVRGGYRAEGQLDEGHFDFTHPDRRVCEREFHAAARRARMRWVWHRLTGGRRQGQPTEGSADVLPSIPAGSGDLPDRGQEDASIARPEGCPSGEDQARRCKEPEGGGDEENLCPVKNPGCGLSGIITRVTQRAGQVGRATAGPFRKSALTCRLWSA